MSSEQKVAAIGGVQRGGEARRQGKLASSGEWSVRGIPGSKEQELAPQREREEMGRRLRTVRREVWV